MDIQVGHWVEVRWRDEPHTRLVPIDKVGTGYVVAGNSAYSVAGDGQPTHCDKNGNVVAAILRAWPTHEEAVAGMEARDATC